MLTSDIQPMLLPCDTLVQSFPVSTSFDDNDEKFSPLRNKLTEYHVVKITVGQLLFPLYV